MATLSNAGTLQPGDKLVTIAVNLSVVVNISAYEREYGFEKASVAVLREDVRYSILSSVEDSSDIFPVESGVLVEAWLR